MKKGFYIPLRFKVLVSLLLGITIVVGVITFTMANLFHTDKTAYIKDLISTNAIHTAQESNALIQNYTDRVKTITRVAYDVGIVRAEKYKAIQDLFQDFPEMVAVIFHEDGVEPRVLFDDLALAQAGLSRGDLETYRKDNPIPPAPPGPDEVLIHHSPLGKDLPTMTMVAGVNGPGSGQKIISQAIVRTDRLIAIVSRSELFEVYLLEPDGSLLVHRDPALVAAGGSDGWLPEKNLLPEQSSLAATAEYAVDGIEMIGGYSRVETGGLIAGARIRRDTAYLSARSLFNNLIYTSLILLLSATAISLIWSYRLTRPLVSLTRAARDIGRGKFEIELKPTSRDEVGSLTESVNHMAHELLEREKALEEAQAALIQSTKMSAFGQMSAGIAHEVKNPLAGILGYTQLSLKKTTDNPEIHEKLKIIEQETRRCNAIIENLMKFARQDKPELKSLAVNDIIEESLVLVDHQMGLSHIQLKRELSEDLPDVKADANQLVQVLMNILINAQQAMDGKPGTITISSGPADTGGVEIRIADTGPGMTEETRQKIFEPFFTTKESGKGTGLGMAVTYGIIQDHGGDIRVESEPGQGAAFIITLPAME